MVSPDDQEATVVQGNRLVVSPLRTQEDEGLEGPAPIFEDLHPAGEVGVVGVIAINASYARLLFLRGQDVRAAIERPHAELMTAL